MLKIFNMMLATVLMLFAISCTKEDNIPTVVEEKLIIPMALIPAGTFQMGNTGAYSAGLSEKPVHTVTISKSFYMSKCEITQKQFNALMDTNSSQFKGDNLPVAATWFEAVLFCNALSQLEGRTCYYRVTGEYGQYVSCNWKANGYRLPTEAEWEYACRAGTTTDFYSGDLIYANDNDASLPNLDKIAWYMTNCANTTHEVGQKEPNAFGLYDMIGNVAEWCWDKPGSYSAEAVTDPISPDGNLSSSYYHAVRGGCWYHSPSLCRSSNRSDNDAGSKYGIRIVRVDK